MRGYIFSRSVFFFGPLRNAIINRVVVYRSCITRILHLMSSHTDSWYIQKKTPVPNRKSKIPISSSLSRSLPELTDR